jgi:hypothetical protein
VPVCMYAICYISHIRSVGGGGYMLCHMRRRIHVCMYAICYINIYMYVYIYVCTYIRVVCVCVCVCVCRSGPEFSFAAHH